MTKQETVAKYRELNRQAQPGKIVCAGSSLMEMFPVNKLAEEAGCEKVIYNRGVSGFVTDELLEVMDVCILDLRPKRLFINIGTNDLSNPQVTISDLMTNYGKILNIVEEALPGIEIYMMAYYPVNYEAATEELKECLKIRTNKRIQEANDAVKQLAAAHHAKYIDVNRNLKDEQGRLKSEYTLEGMHINEEGYRAMFPAFLKYVNEPSWK